MTCSKNNDNKLALKVVVRWMSALFRYGEKYSIRQNYGGALLGQHYSMGHNYYTDMSRQQSQD